MLTKEQIKWVRDFLLEQLSPYYLVIFGSIAKKRVRIDSDVDIAYLSDGMIDDYQTFLLSQRIASQLNREVDLLDLGKTSTVMQAQIVTSGKLIYCSDEQKRMEFEMKVLKMYAKLNEERWEIIQKVRRGESTNG